MMRLLLADDEPLVVESISEFLREEGFETYATCRVDEILPLVRTHRPDALLQDVRMPGIDLPSLVREIRADPAVADMLIVLFSGSLELERIRHQLAVDAAIEKPVDPTHLVDLLRGRLERRHRPAKAKP